MTTLPYRIIIVDSRGFIVYYSQLMNEIEGLAKKDAIGHHFTELYVPSPDSSPITTVINNCEPLDDLFEIYESRKEKVINSPHTVLPVVFLGIV